MQFSTSNRQALLKGYSLPFGNACIHIRMYISISIILSSRLIFTLHDSREKPVLLEKSRLVEHQLAMNYKKPDSNSRRRPKIEL